MRDLFVIDARREWRMYYTAARLHPDQPGFVAGRKVWLAATDAGERKTLSRETAGCDDVVFLLNRAARLRRAGARELSAIYSRGVRTVRRGRPLP